jgi:hypothetical protein
MRRRPDVHAVAADEGGELVARHRLRAPAPADADIAEHLLEPWRRDDPDEVQVRAARVVDAVPDAAAHEDGAARPDGDPPAVEDGRSATGVYEEDLVLMLVQVHRDRGSRTEALVPHGEERRPDAAPVHLDRHVAAARGRPQPQRLTLPRTQHQPPWLHGISSRPPVPADFAAGHRVIEDRGTRRVTKRRRAPWPHSPSICSS